MLNRRILFLNIYLEDCSTMILLNILHEYYCSWIIVRECGILMEFIGNPCRMVPLQLQSSLLKLQLFHPKVHLVVSISLWKIKLMDRSSRIILPVRRYELNWRWKMWWLRNWPEQVWNQENIEVVLLGSSELAPFFIIDQKRLCSQEFVIVQLVTCNNVEHGWNEDEDCKSKETLGLVCESNGWEVSHEESLNSIPSIVSKIFLNEKWQISHWNVLQKYGIELGCLEPLLRNVVLAENVCNKSHDENG